MRFLRIAAAFMLGFSVLPLQAEILKEWSFDSAELPEGVKADGDSMTAKISSEVKDPDGKNSLELTLLKRPEKGPAHSVMFNFISKQKIAVGDKLRLSFKIKSSASGKVPVSAIIGQPPWTTIGSSGGTMNLNNEWQEYSKDFNSNLDYSGDIRAPMLMFGFFPVGEKLYISDVKLEKLENFIPLALNKSWTLYLKPELKDLDISSLNSASESLGGVKGEKCEFIDDAIDLIPLCKITEAKTPALLINEFEAPEDGFMQVGCSADYWFEFIVNGKTVYDTLVTGNHSVKYQKTDHVFNFKVRKGKNIVAVKLLSGSAGWKFLCGAVPFREKLDRITEIVRGKEWRPVKMDKVEWTHISPKRIPQLEIVKGTALDLSQYLPDYEIDKLGRIITAPDGHFTFENDKSLKPRLRGFNFIPGSWTLLFTKYTKEELDAYAEQIKLHGMNVLRFHFLDTSLCGRGGLPKTGKERKDMKDITVAQTVDYLPIDKDFLERFDYFTKACRDRGIYLMLDIMTDSHGWTYASTANDRKDTFRYRIFRGDKLAMDNWKAGLHFLMNHKNIYTGLVLKDDPQFFAITFFNEFEHQFSDAGLLELNEEWTAYRRETVKEGEITPISRKLIVDKTEEAQAARDFLKIGIDKVNKFFSDSVKESGFKGYVTEWDMFMRNLEAYARKDMSAIAMHTYFAHPNEAPLYPPTYQQKLLYGSWLKGKMKTIAQESSIVFNNSYLGRASVTREFGKPFLMTEYSHNGYNIYSYEAGPMQGAYAALQGWDALLPHANSVRLYYEPFQPYAFDSAENIMGKLAALMTAFAWQRGDVKESESKINYPVAEKTALGKDMIGAIGTGYNALFMLSKVGGNVGAPKQGVNLNVIPESFTGASSMGMWVQLEEDREEQLKILEKMIGTLRTEKLLDPENLTDIKKGVFQSSTKEIMTNTTEKTIEVRTPRFESATQAGNRKVKIDALEIESVSKPCTIAAVSLDEKKNLRSSGHILLIFATMFAAENSVWATENFNAELDVGRLQLLCRAGKFSVKLGTDQKTAPKVYVLNLNGTREKEIPVVLKDGKLEISVDTSTFEYGSPYFEIVY